MTSALTSRGSTAAWRRLRAAAAENLQLLGSAPCWRAATHSPDRSPSCTTTVTPDQPWSLGHTTDRALGGDDTGLAYECRPCSDHSGGKLGARLATANQRARTRRPSRAW